MRDDIENIQDEVNSVFLKLGLPLNTSPVVTFDVQERLNLDFNGGATSSPAPKGSGKIYISRLGSNTKPIKK